MANRSKGEMGLWTLECCALTDNGDNGDNSLTEWGGATRVVKASLIFLCDYVNSCLIYPSKATIHVHPDTISFTI